PSARRVTTPSRTTTIAFLAAAVSVGSAVRRTRTSRAMARSRGSLLWSSAVGASTVAPVVEVVPSRRSRQATSATMATRSMPTRFMRSFEASPVPPAGLAVSRPRGHARCGAREPMARPLHALPPWTPDGDLHVVVECVLGARLKLKYDPAIEAFTLVRTLGLGAAFPCEFGFVPGTLAEDGDPLDAVVLIDAPTAVGCVLRCRPVALVEITQRG